jgi:DNA-directed RNA polymerase subunit RPC12/RpoP
MVLEKATFGYEIDNEVLKTLDELKGEVELNDSPFLVHKKVKCSICGKEITRNKNFPRVVCFDCKVERQRIYNSSYKPAAPQKSS